MQVCSTVISNQTNASAGFEVKAPGYIYIYIYISTLHSADRHSQSGQFICEELVLEACQRDGAALLFADDPSMQQNTCDVGVLSTFSPAVEKPSTVDEQKKK